MESIILTAAVFQQIGVALGMGSSTLAVLSFFLAIKDGRIEPVERQFMGLTYLVLRVGMVLILLTTLALAFIGFSASGVAYFTVPVIATIILTAMLYLNSILMTMHLMPSKFGPAIQASSWYTLGFLFALLANGVNSFSLGTFLLGYLGMFILFYLIINLKMASLKKAMTKPEEKNT